MPDIGHNEPVLAVSDALAQARGVLENAFFAVWIEGEVSDMFKARSGHWYFKLKDDEASMSCVMFATNNRRLRYDFEDGMLVRVKARLSIYQQRGEFQAVVSVMEIAGEGELQAALKRLVEKLRGDGLLDAASKRELPPFPERIAMVTSPQGDAPRDIIAAVGRRFPLASIVLIPTRVQGEGAGEEIAAALGKIPNLVPPADLVVVTRGGGSLEDLWTFNLEVVARAIFDCPIPVVSAIGHEMDNTVADLVSDLRAPTPSTAAELITPNIRDLHAIADGAQQRMYSDVNLLLIRHAEHLSMLQARLSFPIRQLEQQAKHVLYTRNRMDREISKRLGDISERLANSRQRIRRLAISAIETVETRFQADVTRLVDPRRQLEQQAKHVLQTRHRMYREISKRLGGVSERLANSRQRMHRLAISSIERVETRLKAGATRLVHPRMRIEQEKERLSGLESRLGLSMGEQLKSCGVSLDNHARLLLLANPIRHIRREHHSVHEAQRALLRCVNTQLKTSAAQLEAASRTLDAVSPLATLDRGYAIASIPDETEWGTPVSDLDEVGRGDTLHIHVRAGMIKTTVEEVREKALG